MLFVVHREAGMLVVTWFTTEMFHPTLGSSILEGFLYI